MQSAHPEEMVFVLLSRDPAAPAVIRAWVAERLRLNKNKTTDQKIVEALKCADTMEEEADRWEKQQRKEQLDMWEAHDAPLIAGDGW